MMPAEVTKGKVYLYNTIHRLPLLQDQDEFQPPYRLTYMLPDIPVRPKLFKYKLDSKKAYQYDLSSVEMNQDHLINVDYNMGMHVDFVDRDAYLVDPPVYEGPNNIKRENLFEGSKKQLEEIEVLRQTLFTEKDKFLLSDKNLFDSPMKGKNQHSSKNIKLPSRYMIVDKVQKWGVDIRDPLAVRQLSDAEQSEDEIIMTSNDNKHLKDKAIM